MRSPSSHRPAIPSSSHHNLPCDQARLLDKYRGTETSLAAKLFAENMDRPLGVCLGAAATAMQLQENSLMLTNPLRFPSDASYRLHAWIGSQRLCCSDCPNQQCFPR